MKCPCDISIYGNMQRRPRVPKVILNPIPEPVVVMIHGGHAPDPEMRPAR